MDPLASPSIVNVTFDSHELKGITDIDMDFGLYNGNGYTPLTNSKGERVYVPVVGGKLTAKSDIIIKMAKTPDADRYVNSMSIAHKGMEHTVKKPLPSDYAKDVSISFKTTPDSPHPISINFKGYVSEVVVVVPTNVDEHDASKQENKYSEYEIHIIVFDESTWDVK